MADFATTAELGAFLGMPGDAGTRGTLMLTLASALIRLHTGQTLDEVQGAQEAFGPTSLDVLFLTERPVTAVSSVVENGTTITDYIWTRWGTVRHGTDASWDTGNTVVTYDSGFAPASSEMTAIKSICLEVATRAFTNEREGLQVQGLDIPEAIGWTPHLYLTPEEQRTLMQFGPVMVG